MIHYIENAHIKVGVKEMGAELTSLFDKERPFEYLWQGDPDVWYGQSPVLFPIVGRLKRDRYTLGGTEYRMPKHGIARKRPFSIEKCAETEMTFLQTEDEQTLAMYPYRYRLRQTFSISDRTLTVTLSVENNNDNTMYFALGAHPGFRCRVGDRIEFEKAETLDTEVIDPELSLRLTETVPLLRHENVVTITPHIFDRDALILKNVRSEYVTLQADGGERPVRFRFRAPYLGVWAKPGAPYVCLEPWFGVDDSVLADGVFESKEGNRSLPPGETFSMTWSAQV